jgi:FkbM family methyltransferase
MLLARVVSKVQRVIFGEDRYLSNVSGVIHIGANTGQERDSYAARKLPVIWIEPIPGIFHELMKNIAPYPNQRAFCRLITDRDGADYTFHVANNGQSSSILELAHHRELWPEVGYVAEIPMQSTTLDRLVEQEHIDLSVFNALILDVQGAELLVLKGAVDSLTRMRYIKTEAANFEAYSHCCTMDELSVYLKSRGFRCIAHKPFASKHRVGTYYNVLYQRRKSWLRRDSDRRASDVQDIRGSIR